MLGLQLRCSFLHFRLLCVGDACLLGLRIGDTIDLLFQTLRSFPCLPGTWTFVAEEYFNLLDSLATGLWVGKEELDRAENTEGSEKQEKTVLDVLEGGRNEETNGSVELEFH